MATVRVKEGVACVVWNHDTQSHVSLAPGAPFSSDDPFVKAHAWAFESDSERDARVEDASADPGRKRAVRKP
jgi:hypothetical protein